MGRRDVCGERGDGTGELDAATRRSLGLTLRSFYEDSIDGLPLPDAQVDLLLRLRHKERDLRRAAD